MTKFKNQPKLTDMCKHMSIKICKADEVVITEGEIGDTFYILVTGKLIVYKSQKVRYAIN